MSETAISKWSWLCINKKYLRILQALEFKMIGIYDTVPIVALELKYISYIAFYSKQVDPFSLFF